MVWYIHLLWRVVKWSKKNMEIDEEHDVDCAVEWFHFARRKFDRDAKGGRGAVGIGYYCMNI